MTQNQLVPLPLRKLAIVELSSESAIELSILLLFQPLNRVPLVQHHYHFLYERYCVLLPFFSVTINNLKKQNEYMFCGCGDKIIFAD